MGGSSEIGSSGNKGYKDGVQTYLDGGSVEAWSSSDVNNHETSPMLKHRDLCPEAQCDPDSNDDILNRTRIRYALAICTAFFFVELVFGFLTHSLAILSDSFHLLSDVAGFLVSLVAFHLSRRPATMRHSYGFYRIEVLGALGSTFIIWAMTGILFWEAIGRIKSPVDINAPLMFATAAAGLVVNIVIGFVLNSKHGHATGMYHHSHSHHAHETSQESPIRQSTALFSSKQTSPETSDAAWEGGNNQKKRGLKNINVQSASIHVIGDIISSSGVLVASIIIMFYPNLQVIDPICTFIFSILVIFTTLRIIRNSLTVLMEATPNGIDSAQVYNDLLSIKGVKDVHDLHIWNLTLGKPSLSVHLHISSPPRYNTGGTHDYTPFEKEYTRILSASQNLACSKYGIHHVTIQIETDDYQGIYDDPQVETLLPNENSITDTFLSPFHKPRVTRSYSQPPSSSSNLFQRYRPHCDNAMCRVSAKKQVS